MKTPGHVVKTTPRIDEGVERAMTLTSGMGSMSYAKLVMHGSTKGLSGPILRIQSTFSPLIMENMEGKTKD